MLRKNKKKILCYVLIYDQFDIIKKCLDFITKNAAQLDIVVIENPSEHTDLISKYIKELGDNGLIKRYYLFDSNITNNAYTEVFKKEANIIKKSPYIIQTDGDLTSESEDWLDEELHIINKHRDVFACGISLDKSNLPIKTFPDAKNWIPKDTNETEDYYEVVTGTHLLMHRGKEYYGFLEWSASNNVHMVDSSLHDYCYRVLGRKWARTKNSVAYHLTWDLYQNKSHPYTSSKDKMGYKKLWGHGRTDSYKLIEY